MSIFEDFFKGLKNNRGGRGHKKVDLNDNLLEIYTKSWSFIEILDKDFVSSSLGYLQNVFQRTI